MNYKKSKTFDPRMLLFNFTDKINSKSDSHLWKKFFFNCFSESLLKMIKNLFYLILKALFVLKIFTFLS